MPTTGLSLDSGVLTTLSNTAQGIANSVVNIAPEIIVAGVAVFGVLLIFNKLPKWFKSFAR